MYQELQKKIKSSNEQIKHSKVNKIFTDISEGYDFMNDLMSFGLHRIWKEEFIEKAKRIRTHNAHVWFSIVFAKISLADMYLHLTIQKVHCEKKANSIM